jgi:hypothetical protein
MFLFAVGRGSARAAARGSFRHTKATGSLIGMGHPFWPVRPGSPGSDGASPYQLTPRFFQQS